MQLVTKSNHDELKAPKVTKVVTYVECACGWKFSNDDANIDPIELFNRHTCIGRIVPMQVGQVITCW